MKKKNTKKIDWSHRRYKERLVDARKFLWLDDTLDKLATWLRIRHGMTVVDVGCGLGYLGYTYWPYFGKGGRYVGVDLTPKLLIEAAGAATHWSKKGDHAFVAGNAYRLPLPDDFADLVMCQTLLLQLKDPQSAVNEMVRVAKPGSLIVCKEPDNMSWVAGSDYSSLPEPSLKEQLLQIKIYLICYKGRTKLGEGDFGVGRRVAHMMRNAGLVDIDVRMNDRVYFLEPPYLDQLQQHELKMLKKEFLNEKRDSVFWWNKQKEWFLAGGGDLKEFERVRRWSYRIRRIFRKQIRNRTYFGCGAGFFFVTKGKKPG